MRKSRWPILFWTLFLCCGLFPSDFVAQEPEASAPGSKDPKMVRIKGKAFLPDGSPATDLEILISGKSKTDSNAGGTSNSYVKNGVFDGRAFPNADYMISVFDPKGKWAAPFQRFFVKDEEELAEEIVFRLEEGIRIHGKVVDETTGKPIPFIEMSISEYDTKRNDGVDTHFRTKTDANGEYDSPP